MNDSDLKLQLDTIINDLAKIDGVDGSLIVDGNSDVLSHNIVQDADIELFGPMANVITSSSKRLINFTNQGEIERVLVESKRGKALFMHLGNVHFIVLTNSKANMGMVMISSKKAAGNIIKLTKNLSPIELEEQVAEIPSGAKSLLEGEQITDKASDTAFEESAAAEEIKEEPLPLKETSSREKVVTEERISTEKGTFVGIQDQITEGEVLEEETQEAELPEPEVPEPELQQQEVPAELLEEAPEPGIPIIKPPIAFPKLEKITKVPENEAQRAELILKIYESIFKAMSIGASKIMGVAPARGLTRKFLPVKECKKLLDGVDVKSNSTIDFDKIRENAEKVPLSERQSRFIENFTKIIYIITENYGQVMGYAAFRGMVRPEFKIITESYGAVMEELGIKDKMHPELLDLFRI